MTTSQNVYIVAACRTPVGKAPRGVFKDTRPDDLLAHVLQGVLSQVPALDPHMIDDVIVGCAMPEAEQGMNVARISALLAGIPDSVPAMTVNRFCASGLQAIAQGANAIATRQAEVILAGGTESMSLVPMGGHSFRANPRCFTDPHRGIAYGMGITAEKVATQWQIDREAQEAFALQSHERALAAIDRGDFQREILPFAVTQSTPNLRTGEIQQTTQAIAIDEGPRAGSTPEQLAQLPTVFAAKGTVTAATSSQMSDGAAALVLVSEHILKQYNLSPLARFVGYRVAGVAPEIMGIGPVKAIPSALAHAGLTLQDLDWIELNEAFAAQSLAVIKELALDPEKVNPLGGAIALGHPLGATGAIRATTLIHGLRQRKQRYGMVTMCVGTGMGAAGIFEAL